MSTTFIRQLKGSFDLEPQVLCLHLGPGLRQPRKTSCNGHIHDAKNKANKKPNQAPSALPFHQYQKNAKEP